MRKWFLGLRLSTKIMVVAVAIAFFPFLTMIIMAITDVRVTELPVVSYTAGAVLMLCCLAIVVAVWLYAAEVLYEVALTRQKEHEEQTKAIAEEVYKKLQPEVQKRVQELAQEAQERMQGR